MFNENENSPVLESIYSINNEQFYQQDLADFNTSKADFLCQISILLYNYDNMKIFQLVEEWIPDFFVKYLDLKMLLLKLEFFNFIVNDQSKEMLLNFYNQNILQIIFQNSNYKKTGDYLHFLSMHPDIIKSRYYQTKFEEVCNIFLMAMEKAYIQIFYPANQFVDSRHTCGQQMKIDEYVKMDCLICLDDYSFFSNYERVFSFEEEMWIHYLHNTHSFTIENHLSAAFSEQTNFEIMNLNENDSSPSYDSNNVFSGMNLDTQMNFGDILKEKETNLLNNININITNIKHEAESNDQNQSIYNESFHSKSTRQKFLVNKSLYDNNEINSKKEIKKKLKIPFFKEFNFRFTKRENIDKKILRKSRKFLKDKFKKNKINFDEMNLSNSEKNFWINYFNQNLLPPMKYNDKENNELIEFKSFNTNYMVWLLSHKGSVELYDIYLKEKFGDLVETFLTKFNVEEQEEVNQLTEYIKNIAIIFYDSNSEKDFDENFSMIPEEIVNTEMDYNDFYEGKCYQCDIFNDIKFENV